MKQRSSHQKAKGRQQTLAISPGTQPHARVGFPVGRERLLVLAVCLISVAAFLPALSQGFIYDDRSNIVENENYRGLDPARLKWMFTTFHMGHYQPLSWLTLGIDYVIWGMNPLGYHLTNLLLHGANTLLVYLLARRLISLAWKFPKPGDRLPELLPIGAAVTALIFGIHPMRVESVLWITERRDVLSSFLTLATLHAYLNAQTGSPDRRTKWFIAAVGIYVLSLMSRALGVTLPVILLLMDWFPLRRFEAGRLTSTSALRIYREKIVFMIPAIAAAIVAPMAQIQAGAATTLTNHGMAQRIAQAFYGLVFYVYKGLLPTNLTPIYELAIPLNIFAFKYVISALIVIAAIVYLFLVRRTHAGYVVAALCYAITLSPVLGLLQSGRQEVADRYSYLSTIGLAILLGAAVIRYLQRVPLRQAVAGPPAAVSLCLTGVLFILTWRQCLVWSSSEGLWRYAVENGPPSAMAHYNLGCELANLRQTDDAIEQFQKSLDLNSFYPEAHFNLANALQENGLLDEAERGYRAVLDLRPEFHLAVYELGNVAAKQGKADEAIALFRQALPSLPNHARCRQRLAAQLIDKGQIDEANQLLDESMRLDSNLAESHYDRGRIYGMTGRFKQAEEEYRKALSFQSAYPEAKVNLGAMMMRQGDIAGAMLQYNSALSDEPLHKEALFNLAVAYSNTQKLKEAEEQYRKLIEAYPEFVMAHFNLGVVLTNANRLQDARAAFEQVLKLDPGNENAKRNLEALQQHLTTTRSAG
jgi:tetratricopeptide (TPR) repeat protein